MTERWINLISGAPIIADFGQTRGLGSPICVDVLTGIAYFLASGDVITPIGGGGSWVPLVDGSEPPNFITDGSGNLILVGGP
jgi:hypothetical protein